MFDFIKTIFDIFIDKSKSFGYKINRLIIVLFLFLIIDLCFNISYKIFISNKLNNLVAISHLKEIYKNDSIQYNEIIKVEKKIIKSEHYSDFLPKLFFKWSEKIFQKGSLSKKNNPSQYKKDAPTIIKKVSIKQKILMLVTSNIVFIIIFPMFLLLPFYTDNKKNKEFYYSWLMSMLLIVVWVFLSTFLLSLIPIIFKNIVFNYILNGIIHITVCTILISYGEKK